VAAIVSCERPDRRSTSSGAPPQRGQLAALVAGQWGRATASGRDRRHRHAARPDDPGRRAALRLGAARRRGRRALGPALVGRPARRRDSAPGGRPRAGAGVWRDGRRCSPTVRVGRRGARRWRVEPPRARPAEAPAPTELVDLLIDAGLEIVVEGGWCGAGQRAGGGASSTARRRQVSPSTNPARGGCREGRSRLTAWCTAGWRRQRAQSRRRHRPQAAPSARHRSTSSSRPLAAGGAVPGAAPGGAHDVAARRAPAPQPVRATWPSPWAGGGGAPVVSRARSASPPTWSAAADARPPSTGPVSCGRSRATTRSPAARGPAPRPGRCRPVGDQRRRRVAGVPGAGVRPAVCVQVRFPDVLARIDPTSGGVRWVGAARQ
jgi:hypothetical protein